MNITSQVWDTTRTGTKIHAFGEDGSALCRSSIRAFGPLAFTLKRAQEQSGHSLCGTCQGKFQSLLNVETADIPAAEEAPAAVTPALKIATAKPEIAPKVTPELIQALATLRTNVRSDETSERVSQAIVILDNAGVFAAIDAAPACTCPPSYAANDHHDGGCPQAPVSKCTCPASRVSFPGGLSGVHTANCPEAPAAAGIHIGSRTLEH